MKKYIFLALITVNTLIAFSAQAQENQKEEDYWALNISDPFLEPNCPLMDGATMWILRQKIATRAVETIVQTELAPASGSQDSMRKARIETYLTVVDAEPFSSIMGFKYFQADILAENHEEFGKTVQNLWLWNATKYVVDSRTNLMIILEYNKRGIDEPLKQEPGDQIWGYFMYDYAFSKHWQIMCFGLYNVNYMSEERINWFLPAAQARWEPSNEFKLAFGAPAIAAFEWSLTPQLGLAAKYFMNNQIGAFCRYKISEVFSISLVYDRVGNQTYSTYFNPKSYSPIMPAETITYTNMTQMIDQISLEFGILTNPEVALNIAVGYSAGEDIVLKDNLDKKGTVAGASEYFVRLQVHHLNIWK